MLDATSFGALLARHIRRRGWSHSETARQAGLNASIISRYCSGEKDSPERASVIGLARALALPPADYDALMASAGYLPPSLQKLGAGDSTVAALVGVLGNDRIDPASRADLRACVETMCGRWQGMEQPKAERRAS